MSAKGSAPIETVALITLLLVPIGPALGLYEQISNQLAAESIARHAIRSSVLSAEVGQMANLSQAIDLLSHSWQKPVTDYHLHQDGELVTLRVQVGNALGFATIGLEPTK